ncbi:MAG: chromate transporter [Acidaminococcaceae bacterium]
MPNIKLLHVFCIFFKLGLFTIGGGLAMIPLIQHECVEKQHWLDAEDITDVLALSQSLPGVIAINAATFIGYRLAGITGALVATLGVILPSFLIIFALVLFFTGAITHNPYLQKFFAGVNAAITVLIFGATLKLLKTSITDRFGWVVATASFLAILAWSWDVATIVLLAALAGYLWHRTATKEGGQQ